MPDGLAKLLIILLTFNIVGCRDRTGHPNHTLITEFRWLAEFSSNHYQNEIGADDGWRCDIGVLIKDVKKAIPNDYLAARFIESDLIESGGNDLWGNQIRIYRRIDSEGDWIVVESAGPDGDFSKPNDNIEAVWYFPNDAL